MIEISVDLSGLEKLSEMLARAPERLNEVLVEATMEAEDVAFLKITEHPPPMNFPPSEVKWDSQKQRRAYHATNGFGGGDPYLRVGALTDSFQESAPQVTPGLVTGKVFSVDQWVQYVKGNPQGGVEQSDIQKGRWKTLQQDRDALVDDVTTIFKNAIQRNISRIFGNA